MAATHFNILAWRISWTEEPGGLQSTGLHRIRHDWSNLACTHILNTYLFWDHSILQFLSFLFSSLPSSPLSFCFFLSPFLKKKKKISFFPVMGSFLKISLEIYQSAICINWTQLQTLKSSQSIDTVRSDEGLVVKFALSLWRPRFNPWSGNQEPTSLTMWQNKKKKKKKEIWWARKKIWNKYFMEIL